MAYRTMNSHDMFVFRARFNLFTNRTIGNDILFCWYQSYHSYQWNYPVPSQVTWENNRSLLNEKHIHQQNYWNDILFYGYQWTVGIALYPARSHAKIIEVPLLRCIFTNRTTGMTSLSIGTNHTISTNGPSV